MIPSALFFAILHDGTKVRALELAPDFFTFRLAKEKSPASGKTQVYFLDPASSTWHRIVLDRPEIREEKEERFWNTFRLRTDDPAFKREASSLSHVILSYVRLRLAEDTDGVQELLSSFRPGKETSENLRRQEEKWLSACSRISFPRGMQTGVFLSAPDLCHAFLEKPGDAFFSEYFGQHPAGKQCTFERISYLHLGSAFCPHLLPDSDALTALLAKARAEDLIPVLVLPPMPEHTVEQIGSLLDEAEQWAKENDTRLETECGDAGEIDLILERGYAHLVPTAGVALAKRRKDPRLSFLPFGDAGHFSASLDSSPSFFHIFHVARTAAETCGYVPEISEVSKGWTLYGPYYEVSLADACTLSAAVRTGKRGMQTFSSDCPQYCRDHAFLYPDDYHLAGIGNTIQGFDPEAFSETFLQDAAEHGADRFVFDFPGGRI